MRIATLLFFNVFLLFSQNKEIGDVEKKIIKYISQCENVSDLKGIESFQIKFQEIFDWYPNINPINPKVKPGISSGFSSKRLHPIEGKNKAHNGVDIVARKNTPIYAAASGTVQKSKFFNGKAGHSVVIKHKYGFVTKYFHLSLYIVKTGENVKKGQVIGFLGTSGSSTGPHLHYEIVKNEKYINPINFLINP